MLTDGLLLRDFRPEDIGLISQLSEDPEVEYFDGNPVVGGWFREEEQQLTWVAELLGVGPAQAFGVVICRRVSREPAIYTIGIDLVAECRGLGLGRIVMRQVLRRLFVDLLADRVELLVRDYNQRAIRCYEAVGFRHEGLRRQCGQTAGMRYGELLMGLLREEYFGPVASRH